MRVCKECNKPGFWGVFGYDKYNFWCYDCTRKLRLEGKFISIYCKDHVYSYSVEKARHDRCNQDQIDYMWCHCECHK